MHASVAGRPTLLFVDDEQRVLNSMRAMFRREYELFLATRGEEALRIVAVNPIDVIIADQRMPGMTGVELLAEVRRRSPHTVRILLTGDPDPAAARSARRDGEVFCLLNKPCPAEELRTVVAEAVQVARERAVRPAMVVVEGGRDAGAEETVEAAAADGVVDRPAPTVTPRADDLTALFTDEIVADVDGTAETGEYPVIDLLPEEEVAGGESSAAPVLSVPGDAEVDELADTNTMEIVMAGDMITVHEADESPWSYRAGPPIAPGMILQDPEPDEETDEDPGGEHVADDEDGGFAQARPPAAAPVEDAAADESATASDAGTQPVAAAARWFSHALQGVATMRRSPALLVAAAGVVIAMLAVLVLLLARQSQVPPAVPVDPEPPATASMAAPDGTPAAPDPSRGVGDKLRLGNLALEAGALIAPPGSNALSFFLDARAEAPDDPAVNEAIGTLAQHLEVRARSQLGARDFPGLATTLAALSALDPDDARLVALRDDYAAAVEAGFAEAEAEVAAGQWDAALERADEMARWPGVSELRVNALREAIDAGREQPSTREPVIADSPAAGGVAADVARQGTPAAVQAAPREPAAADVAADLAQQAAQVAPPAAANVAADVAQQPVPATAEATPREAAAANVAADVTQQPAPAAAQAAPREPAAPPSTPNADTLLASAASSVAAGRLVAPPGDNARAYLAEARAIEPDHPRLAAGLGQLAEALAARALAHANGENWSDAEAAWREADALDAAPDIVASARERIIAERAARTAATAISLSQMRRREFVAPQYPARALREKEDGWVVLTFTVLPDGSVTDVNSEKASGRYGRQFASAARTAVLKWKFEPQLFLGEPIPQRVRARINFEPDG